MKKLIILLAFGILIIAGLLVHSELIDRNSFVVSNPHHSTPLTLKGQLHSHTSNSRDGVTNPADLVKAYKNAGYDFISITDHDHITVQPEVDGMLFIGGVEEAQGRNPHILVYNITEQSHERDPLAIINEHLNNRASLVGLAHPEHGIHSFSQDTLQHSNVQLIEVFNAMGGLGEDSWDFMLTHGKRVYGIATDDNHDLTKTNFDRGWVVAHVNSRSEEGVLDALRSGNFYASTGNDLKVEVKESKIIATSTNSSKFEFVSQGKVIHKATGQTATYNINGREQYVRIKATKADGQAAWSQPIFIEIRN